MDYVNSGDEVTHHGYLFMYVFSRNLPNEAVNC